MNEQPVILIAEDELPTRRGIMNLLTNWSQGRYMIRSAENGIEALDITRNQPIDLLITDIRMPGLDGIELLKAMKEDGQETCSILLTGYAEFEYARSALTLGVLNYLLKPVEPQELIDAVEQALIHAKTIKQAAKRKIQQPVIKNDFIKQALQFIHHHITDPSLGIKEVSEHIHLSPSYFSVLFKDEMQVTFSDYITKCRIELAKQMILNTNRKIYEIATEVGFSSSKYFVKVFRLIEGVTPKRYRKVDFTEQSEWEEEDVL